MKEETPKMGLFTNVNKSHGTETDCSVELGLLDSHHDPVVFTPGHHIRNISLDKGSAEIGGPHYMWLATVLGQ